MSDARPTERRTRSVAGDGDLLDPVHLVNFAGELDVAGDACKVMADRNRNRGSRVRYLSRASACYGAASLLRKIAE